MPRRMEQVNSLVQQALGEIFTRVLEFPIEFFVTITKVDIDPDLRGGKVYVSVIPFAKSQEALAFIIRQRKTIQHELARSVKLQFTPILIFKIDDTEEQASKIEKLIDEVTS